MSIYSRPDLDTFAFGHSLGEREVLRGLDVLARLQHLHRSGYWSSLSESNVEHSFVERVFAEVFGYATLLGDPTGEHEVLPKPYVPLPGAKKAFPDFTLGFFRADLHSTVVTAELKGPAANLDAPQGGRYGGQSPAQQAMRAARHAGAEWCIVSNTNEVRLYRVPDEDRYEHVYLLDIVSPQDFRRAHALLSRRSLLGRSGSEASPLSRFHSHAIAGESMLIPARDDRVRLIQRIRPHLGGAELPFTRLSQLLEGALERVPDMASQEFKRPRLEADRLVIDKPWQRIAVVKSGLLACSFSIPLGNDASKPDQPIYVDPCEALRFLADMTGFGWAFFEPIKCKLVFEWSLEDLSARVHTNDRKKWTKPTPHTPLVCQANVERTSYPEVSWHYVDGVARTTVASRLGEVIRELFFPFHGNDDQTRLCRLEPTDAQVIEELDAVGTLAVFP